MAGLPRTSGGPWPRGCLSCTSVVRPCQRHHHAPVRHRRPRHESGRRSRRPAPRPAPLRGRPCGAPTRPCWSPGPPAPRVTVRRTRYGHAAGRTGRWRCRRPAPIDVPAQEGRSDRIGSLSTVLARLPQRRYGGPTTGRSTREPAQPRSADELRGWSQEVRRAAKNAPAAQAELVSLHGFFRTPTARLAGPAACSIPACPNAYAPGLR